MEISVVIPTWNEERWLPQLLSRLRQCPGLKEIIVADNASSDATLEVAAGFGCKTVKGGSPAQGRNSGARASSGDIILFVDADARPPFAAISRLRYLFQDPKVAAVHFRLVPVTATTFVRACYRALDLYLSVLSRLGVAHGPGTLIAVRRDVYLKVNGFREDIVVGEDHDFLRRVGESGTVVYDRSLVVRVSPRRFWVENPYVYAAKVVLWAVLRLTKTRRSLIPYRWLNYGVELTNQNQFAPAPQSQEAQEQI